jgi:hypothetical protein
MRGDELRGCLAIEIRNKAGEVLGKSQEFKYSNQLSLIRREKSSFKVKVTEDNALFVGVCILHTKAEASNRLAHDRSARKPLFSGLRIFRASM